MKGSALISALFVMTLVAIIATAMSLQLRGDIYRTRSIIMSDKLYLASEVVTLWALDSVARKKYPLSAIDSYGKLLELPEDLINDYPGVTLSGELFDLQARFNINNLQQKEFKEFFYRFLKSPDFNVPSTLAIKLVNSTSHWVNQNKSGSHMHQQIIDNYMHQKSPYLPAFSPMSSVTELRLIDGVNTDIYKRIIPYLIALPEVTPININTAPKQLLMALGHGLKESQAETIISNRAQKTSPISIAEFKIPPKQITSQSTYFLVQATASMPEFSLTVYSVIKYASTKTNAQGPEIIYQGFNTL